MWKYLKPLDLSRIEQYPFPEKKYFKTKYKKTQIVLHHTVSGPNISGDVNTWINSKYRIGTCIIVARDGTPYQLFSSRYWAYHLGTGDHEQDKRSIGIEIDNWGGLKPGGGLKSFCVAPYMRGFMYPKFTRPESFYAYYGNKVDVPVQYYKDGYRGYNYYEKYTDEQIKTVGELLLFWRDRYKIPLAYNDKMWDVTSESKWGKPGVWSHTSFRTDKSDVHPQPELIQMLKTIQTL
jgi:N-acetyl-anhydromuramyl-L-alanine amidase AmpD